VKQEVSASTSLHHYQREADNKKGAAGRVEVHSPFQRLDQARRICVFVVDANA
jgi:hypothetical protein